jgi:putative FmdB family regulatory protein
MPTYEYQCEQCGEVSEYLQSMSEAAKTTCELCGGKLVKLLSAGSGLIFKGSGFYITDYKNAKTGGQKSESSKESGKESGSGKESSKGSSEAKSSEPAKTSVDVKPASTSTKDSK